MEVDACLAKLQRDEESKWAGSEKLGILRKGVITLLFSPHCQWQTSQKDFFDLEQDDGI